MWEDPFDIENLSFESVLGSSFTAANEELPLLSNCDEILDAILQNSFEENNNSNISDFVLSPSTLSSSELFFDNSPGLLCTDSDWSQNSPEVDSRIRISPPEFSNFNNDLGTLQGSDLVKLCQVCGDVAGQHNYYGGQVCHSCRAFFRRSVQSNNFEKFSCSKGGKCNVNSRSWRSCKLCRFQRCLRCGMQINWVFNDTERKLKAEKCSKKKNTSIVPLPKINYLSDKFTLEDEIYLKGFTSAFIEFGIKEGVQFYLHNVKDMDDAISALYTGLTLSLDLRVQVRRFMTLRMMQFFGSMADMMHISRQDQSKLISRNYPVIVWLCEMVYLNSSIQIEKHLADCRSKIKVLIEDKDVVTFLESKMEALSLRSDKKANYVYDQMYPDNWAKDKSAEVKHRELSCKVYEWPRIKEEGAPDEILMTLLQMIILFSSDFIELDNPDAVDKVQLKYASMLSRYLKCKYNKDSSGVASKFCNAMTVSSISRELLELTETQMKNKVPL